MGKPETVHTANALSEIDGDERIRLASLRRSCWYFL
jgi:hypothetical protein